MHDTVDIHARAAASPRFGERFESVAQLGSGGMGVVYRAHDRIRRIDVALKALRRQTSSFLYHFKNEFRALADLVHPNLVTLYELRAHGGDWFFTMELVEGVSFLEFVRPHEAVDQHEPSTQSTVANRPGQTTATATADSAGSSGGDGTLASVSARRSAILAASVDLGRLRSTTTQLLRGVGALHSAGKLHRDLKPSNVLVDASGRVVVCDFGLVTDLAPDEARDPTSGWGTPAYMSPEQAAQKTLTSASDLYSIGVMLYEAISGRLPFVPTRDFRAQRQTPAPPVREHAPDAPEPWADLIDALLHVEPEARPTIRTLLSTLQGDEDASPRVVPGPADATPFIGRDTQLAELRRSLADTRTGDCVVALVRGRSGMGKSALVRHFLDQRPQGAIELYGRCYQRESVPYKSLDALVDALTDHLIALPPARLARVLPKRVSALAHLFPTLGRLPRARAASAAPIPADAHEVRRQAFGTLHQILHRLAEDQPVILYVDDLQWGDLDSLSFFSGLMEDRDAPPVLLVATYRAEEEGSSGLLRALLGRAPHRQPGQPSGQTRRVRIIDVEPLTVPEAQNLLDQLLISDRAAMPMADDASTAIIREAGGCPFFLAELARARAAPGTPKGVRDLDSILAERIAGLPGEARALLSATAVAGRPVPTELLSKAAGISDEPAALATLRAERLVRELHGSDLSEVEPYHDRIRETVTARLSERDTRRIHRKLARAFEASTKADAQALVEHWLGAGEPERAGGYALRAAEQAERALAFDRAAHHYSLVLSLLELDGPMEIEIRTRLGDAQALAGRLEASSDAYLAAAELATSEHALELRRRSAEQLLRAGRVDEGIALCVEQLATVGVRVPTSKVGTIALILYSRARNRLVRRKLRPSKGPLSPTEEWILATLWSLSSSTSNTHILVAAASSFRYQQRALAAGDSYHAGLAMSLSATQISANGESQRDEILRLGEEALAVIEQSGSERALALHHISLCVGLFCAGDWQGAIERGELAHEQLVNYCANESTAADMATMFRLMALWFRGRLRQLADEVQLLSRQAATRNNEYLGRALRSWRTNVAWLVLDRPDEAYRHAVSTSGTLPTSGEFTSLHYYHTQTNATIQLYRGDATEAHTTVEDAWPAFRRSVARRVQLTRIDFAYLRGRCAIAAAAADSSRDGLQVARTAIKAIDAERTAWGSVFANLLRASVAQLERDPASARAACDEAATAATERRMDYFAALARLRHGQLEDGKHGVREIASALAWMRDQGIVAPARFAAAFSPGLPAPDDSGGG